MSALTKLKNRRREKSGPKITRRQAAGFWGNLCYDIKHNPFLLLLCLPAVVFFLIFDYSPLVYLVAAFKKYSTVKGLWGSDWVGFKNFKAFFGSTAFFRVTFNTIFLNFLFIATNMVVSIFTAIALSEITAKKFKKITQSIVILPHFLSWAIVAMIFETVLRTDNGLINQILVGLGFEKINFYQNADVWPGLLVALNTWKGAGYGSIVYLATIAGLDQEMYEAARVDGATRGQCIRYLTLPLLKNTAIMLFILKIGGLFGGNFSMIYTLIGNNSLLFRTTDVINTYTYRMLIESNNIGQSSAIGLWQSVMGVFMVMTTNAIAKKADNESALF